MYAREVAFGLLMGVAFNFPLSIFQIKASRVRVRLWSVAKFKTFLNSTGLNSIASRRLLQYLGGEGAEVFVLIDCRLTRVISYGVDRDDGNFITGLNTLAKYSRYCIKI